MKLPEDELLKIAKEKEKTKDMKILVMQKTTSGVDIPVIYERYDLNQIPNPKEQYIDRFLEYVCKFFLFFIELILKVKNRGE
ncbi:MAG: hypothetical protein PHP08_00010 [Candidatus Dojkabacteria bacterium]|nr:hypothetical protein [Candidatus Dojkabacteria bacterium]